MMKRSSSNGSMFTNTQASVTSSSALTNGHKEHKRRHSIVNCQHHSRTNTPLELYPVVHDLSEVEYNTDCGCGETFGSFQLSDLLTPATIPSNSIWNTVLSSSIDDATPDPSPIVKPRKAVLPQRPITPETVPSTPLTQRDSSETCPGSPFNARDEPSLLLPLSCNLSKDEVDEDEDDDASNPYSEIMTTNLLYPGSKNSSKQQLSSCESAPSKKKRLHLRRKSKQLMKLLKAKSSSVMSSSFHGDLSTTCEEMTDSDHFNCIRRQQATAQDIERTFHGTYILTRQVFKCRYSEIWECLERTTGIRFCVKTFERDQLEDFSELDMLQGLTKTSGGHQNLIKLVEVLMDGPKFYVVMEMVEGVNLLSRVAQEGPMEEGLVQDITRYVLEGLLYLHNKSVVHADMQPENVLLTVVDDVVIPWETKIADLGSAVDLAEYEPLGSRYGSSSFTAPEVLKGTDPYDTQADSWSVGCLVYFMLGGASPFSSAKEIVRAEYSFGKFGKDVSRSAKQFISNLIHVDPSVRMTIAEALEHPWLRQPEEEQQHPLRRASFLRHASLGYEASVGSFSDIGNPDSRASSVHGGRRSLSPFPSSVATAKSGKKSHKRLSSLGALGKLFFSKEDSSRTLMSREDILSKELVVSRRPANYEDEAGPGACPLTPTLGRKGGRGRHQRRLSS